MNEYLGIVSQTNEGAMSIAIYEIPWTKTGKIILAWKLSRRNMFQQVPFLLPMVQEMVRPPCLFEKYFLHFLSISYCEEHSLYSFRVLRVFLQSYLMFSQVHRTG